MNIKVIVICTLFFIVGIISMWNNRFFYRRSRKTMLFPAELNLFVIGFFLTLLGGWGIVVSIVKALN